MNERSLWTSIFVNVNGGSCGRMFHYSLAALLAQDQCAI